MSNGGGGEPYIQEFNSRRERKQIKEGEEAEKEK